MTVPDRGRGDDRTVPVWVGLGVQVKGPARTDLRRKTPSSGENRPVPVVLFGVAICLVGSFLGIGGQSLPSAVAGASGSSTGALDAALDAARNQVGAPAAQGAVVSCGHVVWAGASGVKSVTGKEPVSTSTPFVLASTTKTLTAAMVMTLVEKGRLSLDAPLSKFYPALPNAGQITVRMLLNNTSGLPDYADSSQIDSIIKNDPRHHWTTDEIVSVLSTIPAQFAPGAEYLYTNSNWVVLGGIVQRKAGVPLDAYFERAVAKPAGMTTSTFTYQPARSPEFAHPYLKEEGGLVDQFAPGLGLPSNYWGPVWTDGGLASTALDLARFGNALFADRLVNRATLQQMTQFGKDEYGLGLFPRQADGHSWIGHDGAYGGYESEDFTDPSRMVTITVTTNVEASEDSEATPGAAESIWEALVKAYDQAGAAKTACGAR